MTHFIEDKNGNLITMLGDTTPESVICPRCEGSGKVYTITPWEMDNEAPCCTCKGRGKLVRFIDYDN